MIRVKTFDATAIAPNGVLYAGDLNAVQDAAAALTDFSQAISLGSVLIGDNTLQLFKYGAGEVRLTSALRTDGIVRALGGSFTGSFTTTQRDAIPAGSRPYGLAITNTTTNRLEWNSGTDATPVWRPVAADGGGSILVTSDISAQYGLTSALQIGDRGRGAAGINFGVAGDSYIERQGTANIRTNSSFNVIISGVANPFLYYVSGESNPRWYVEGSTGKLFWGPGGGTVVDTSFGRSAAGVLNTPNSLTVGSSLSAAGIISSAHYYNRNASALYYFGTTDDMYIGRDGPNNRINVAPNFYSSGQINAGGSMQAANMFSSGYVLATGTFYNRHASAVYYFGTGDDMYFQRDGPNTRITVQPNLYANGYLAANGAIFTAADVIARNGTSYHTSIGYTAGYPGIYFTTAGNEYIARTAVGQIYSPNQWSIDGTFVTGAYIIFGQNAPRQWTQAWNLTVNPDGGVTTLRVGTSGDAGSGNAAALTAAGVWVNGSSAESKENFEKLNHDNVLDTIMELPLHRYNYKAPRKPNAKHAKLMEHHDDYATFSKRIKAIKHVGPTAEDFYRITGLGLDDKTIAPGDMAGLALMGLQALAARLTAIEQRIN